MFLPHNPDAQLFFFVVIHLAVPAVGFCAYLYLCYRMWKQGIPKPPYTSFFLLFFQYGGWLLVLLTFLFWLPSGMMYIGGLYLLLFAPVITSCIGIFLYYQREISRYHRAAFLACVAYEVLIALIVLGWISFGLLNRVPES